LRPGPRGEGGNRVPEEFTYFFTYLFIHLLIYLFI